MVNYPFQKTDAGRATSRRPRQKNDCTVRALAQVAGVSYDVAYDALAERGRQSHKKTHFPKPRGDDAILGHVLTWMSFPAVKGQRRMTPPEFAKQHTHGRFICQTAKHVYAVIDGVAFDDTPVRDDRCIYGAWSVSKA